VKNLEFDPNGFDDLTWWIAHESLVRREAPLSMQTPLSQPALTTIPVIAYFLAAEPTV